MSEEDNGIIPEEEIEIPEEKSLLVNREEYLAAGVHIGTKLKTKHTQKWIYRTTSYGLYVININATDERLRIAAKFIAKYDPSRVLICSLRRYGRQPIRAFCEVTGIKPMDKRFIPGTLTNPMIADHYFEADLVIIIDPHADKQALLEATQARIPVISFIDTDDTLDGIDLAIPTNNRGRKALSLMLYLLARQVMRERGDIPPDGDIKLSRQDFESKITPSNMD